MTRTWLRRGMRNVKSVSPFQLPSEAYFSPARYHAQSVSGSSASLATRMAGVQAPYLELWVGMETACRHTPIPLLRKWACVWKCLAHLFPLWLTARSVHQHRPGCSGALWSSRSPQRLWRAQVNEASNSRGTLGAMSLLRRSLDDLGQPRCRVERKNDTLMLDAWTSLFRTAWLLSSLVPSDGSPGLLFRPSHGQICLAR